jgi:hypothetical protein
MDLCSLEDAFPNIQNGSATKISDLPYVGGKDAFATKEERRAARKRAKKSKSPSVDPDRPAVERMAPVETVVEQKESFVLPILPKASCLFTDPGTPPYFTNGGDSEQAGSSYFGASGEDEIEEHFSTYSSSPREDINYRLQPDFTKSDMLKGAEKAASQPLPEPPLTDSWKPLTPGASYTSYFNEIPNPKKKVKHDNPDPNYALQAQNLPQSGSSTTGPVAVNDTAELNNQDALMRRIDMLMGRLEQLEQKNKEDSQTEILMFVGTGLFLLMSFELLSRR